MTALDGALVVLVIGLALSLGALVYRAEQQSRRAGQRHFGV